MNNAEKIFRKLDKINFGVVERKVKINYDWSRSKIKKTRKEALRYVALCAVKTDDSVKYTPSETVDKFWHEMILHTWQYRHSVTKALGKFVDHAPNANNKQKAYNDEVSFWATIRDYENVWGEPPLDVWEIKKRKGVNQDGYDRTSKTKICR